MSKQPHEMRCKPVCAWCEEPLYGGAFYVALAGDKEWFIHLAVCWAEFEENKGKQQVIDSVSKLTRKEGL